MFLGRTSFLITEESKEVVDGIYIVCY